MNKNIKDRTRDSLPGLRITNQRALILDILKQGKEHMDADEVYRLARKKQPRISLSTVYRNLQMLKRIGLVDEVHFDEAHHHYEVRETPDGKAIPEHHHLICQKCGRITEFTYPLAQLIDSKVTEARDFQITATETRVLGLCPRCRER
jgi:Fur family transcriptional regulator, ferric uptake regulator